MLAELSLVQDFNVDGRFSSIRHSGVTRGAGVGAATDSRQLLDSRVHSSLVVPYSSMPHPGRTYCRVHHTRVGRTLEYVLPGL